MKNKEKRIEVIKEVGGLASEMCATAFICGIGRAILPPGVNMLAKGMMLAGGMLMSDFIGDKLGVYVRGQLDQTVKGMEYTISELKRCVDVIQDKSEELKKEVVEG